MKIITTGSIPYNPNWGIINLSPFQYLIDCSEEDQVITLPEINTLPPSGVQLLFRLTSDSDFQATIQCGGEDDTFSNGTTNTTLVLVKGFTGSVILSVNNGKWNVSQQSNGLLSPIKIVGKISQSGTNAPTLQIGSFTGDSSLITITPSYSEVGVYKLTFPVGLFTGNVVTALLTPNGLYAASISQSTDNVLTIQSGVFAPKLIDGLLSNCGFSIEINPTVTI